MKQKFLVDRRSTELVDRYWPCPWQSLQLSHHPNPVLPFFPDKVMVWADHPAITHFNLCQHKCCEQYVHFFGAAELLNSGTIQQWPDKTRLRTAVSTILSRTSMSDLSSCMVEWHFWRSSQGFLCPHYESFKQPPCSPGALLVKQINWWEGTLWYCLTGAVVPVLVRGFLALSLENSRSSEGAVGLWHL